MTKASARNIFIGGTGVVMAVFLVLTYMSYGELPARSHPEKITESVVLGKKIWEKHACIDCHTLLGEGAYYAPELANVVTRLGEDGLREVLETAAEEGWGDDRKMPQFDLSPEEINGLVEFFKWMGKIDTNNWPPNKEG